VSDELLVVPVLYRKHGIKHTLSAFYSIWLRVLDKA